MINAEQLRSAAASAARQAYAPYSGLRVGVALRSTQGLIHCGCNVENGALPVGGCAERAALAAAVLAEGPSFRLAAIALIAIDTFGIALPVTPCGACRQALVEFGADAEISFLAPDDSWTLTTAAVLLPHRFELAKRSALEFDWSV